MTGNPSEADIIIVHTCGFIEDAKRESIEGIFQALEATSAGSLDTATATTHQESVRKTPVIVTGCLSQRYADQLLEEIPEIAGVAGTAAPRDIVEIVGSAIGGPARPDRSSSQRLKHVGTPGRGAPGANVRFDKHITSPWAYVRVAEGCRHHCTYCAIPSIRGDLVSRPEDDIIAEARHLASLGVAEINLIAQDLSDYGWDREGRRCLARLVRRLNEVDGISWIRLLYVRPDGVDRELAEAMALPHVAPYIDLPVEHGSPQVLRRMGRPGVDDILRAVRLLRDSVPNLYLRTTVIAGFPGETDHDVELTLSLLSEIRAHRVGAFPFSREEGTPAYNLPDIIPSEVARERAERIRRHGLRLAAESGAAMVGSEIEVLLERPSLRPGYWIGRGPHQAPEVDGITYVRVAPDSTPSKRSLVRARVTRSSVLTLFAHETSVYQAL